MNIYIGSDHRGYNLKEELKNFLKKEKINFVDVGCFSTQSCDYPDFASLVARAISENKAERGILICGTGFGMCITANKFPNVRAVTVRDIEDAKISRLHNNSNVICLSANQISIKEAEEILKVWFTTPFEAEERHIRRLEKISLLEKGENLKEKRIGDYVQELSSEAPTPGGGSAAAFAGLLSSALILMVANLSSSSKYKEIAKEIEVIKEKAEKIKEDFFLLARQDEEVFKQVIFAYKIPVSDAEREEKIQQSLKNSTDISEKIAFSNLLLLEQLPFLSEKGNQNLLSDIGIAFNFACCGLESGIINMRINLKSIKDLKFKQEKIEKINYFYKEKERISVKLIEKLKCLV